MLILFFFSFWRNKINEKTTKLDLLITYEQHSQNGGRLYKDIFVF